MTNQGSYYAAYFFSSILLVCILEFIDNPRPTSTRVIIPNNGTNAWAYGLDFLRGGGRWRVVPKYSFPLTVLKSCWAEGRGGGGGRTNVCFMYTIMGVCPRCICPPSTGWQAKKKRGGALPKYQVHVYFAQICLKLVGLQTPTSDARAQMSFI